MSTVAIPTIDIGTRVLVTALPIVSCRQPRYGTVARNNGGEQFKWFVWLDGDDRATGPYEDIELSFVSCIDT